MIIVVVIQNEMIKRSALIATDSVMFRTLYIVKNSAKTIHSNNK